jgi:hypothetical protein
MSGGAPQGAAFFDMVNSDLIGKLRLAMPDAPGCGPTIAKTAIVIFLYLQTRLALPGQKMHLFS